MYLRGADMRTLFIYLKDFTQNKVKTSIVSEDGIQKNGFKLQGGTFQ